MALEVYSAHKASKSPPEEPGRRERETIEQYLKVTGVMTCGISAIECIRKRYKWTKLFY